MASAQCCKPANECQQKNSLGHKVSEMAGRVLGGHHSSHHSDTIKNQTEVCYSQTTVVSTHGNGRQAAHGAAATHATCQRRSRREHRKKDKNLLEKIKDRISGHRSDSSSSSESDSENENCRKGKN